ncbi:MAG: 1-acyl-sn-glycerol-3-phosphate acyltransferase [Bacteroidota bacterium]
MPRSKITGALDRIDRRSVFYTLLYSYVDFVFKQYYGKVEVSGEENIPRNAPVIYAPNHQNALMDALCILFTSPGDVVFLARADIFRKPWMAKMLNTLKMLPVFRIRDGAQELGKNQEIFDITVGVLHRNHNLCLMPEGNHGDHRRLRTLVKGVFRIAFQAQEQSGNKPDIKIVPVGLDFSDYIKQNQKLLINYGKPIEVSEYWDLYAENNPKGINVLRERLEEEMKKLMIHISNEEYYDVYLDLRTVCNDSMREKMGISGKKLSDRFVADKEMIARLDGVLARDEEKIREIAALVRPYSKGLKEQKIRDWVVRDRGYSLPRTLWRWLTLILTLPVFLYGLINNALVYFIPVLLTRKIKDLQFHSSVKAGASILLVFPLFYILQTLLAGLLTHSWWIGLAYLALLYPTGKLALEWYLRLKKTVKGGAFGWKYRAGNERATDFVKMREAIINRTCEILWDEKI